MTNEKILLQLEKGYDIKNPQLAQALSNLEDKIGITKAELEEAIEAKANLVGGKVPAEELPNRDNEALRFTAQNLTDAQKQLARDNIGAISSDDIPSGGGLSESDLVSIDSDRNIVVASESVESGYPYPKLIVPESSQPQQGRSLTLTDSQILGTLKQTVGGNDVLPSRVLLIFTGNDSHQYQYILYRSYTYLEVSDTLYQYVYYESIGGEWFFRFDANNMDPSKILSRKAANS